MRANMIEKRKNGLMFASIYSKHDEYFNKERLINYSTTGHLSKLNPYTATFKGSRPVEGFKDDLLFLAKS